VNNPRTVAIIGGGISGLATAFSLQEQAAAAGLSIKCTILEASPSWGGKIVTQWPHSMSEYRRRTEADDTAAYETAPA